MRPAAKKDGISLDEYYRREEIAQCRHEYVRGEVFAMSGPSTRHNLISQNILIRLRNIVRGRGCRVFIETVKVQIGDERVYYPDVIVACSQSTIGKVVVTNPSLVVEVTSPSTRAVDRREKWEAYTQIPALETYLIVDQRKRHVLAHRRTPDGWSREDFFYPSAIELPLFGATLSLDEIYEDIDMPPIQLGEEDDVEWNDDFWKDLPS